MKNHCARIGLLWLLGGVAITSGCSHSEKTSRDVAPQTQSQTNPPMSGSQTEQFSPTESNAPRKHGVIYVVSATGGDDNSLVAKPVTWRSSQSPALDSLNALAQVSDSPLPSGTQVRGVKIADGLATVDFSRDFQTNFHGGETGEAQAVNSILQTLGQFPSIDRVQILVEGKPIDALSQLPISAPLDVIRSGAVRQAGNGGG